MWLSLSEEEVRVLKHAIRAARKQKGWAQESCARKIDVTLQTWRRWESTGKEGTVPSWEDLERVADLFGWVMPARPRLWAVGDAGINGVMERQAS